MKHMIMAASIGGLLFVVPAVYAQESARVTERTIGNDVEIEVQEEEKDYPIQLSEEEWQDRLSPSEFRILRKEGTERAYSGELYDTKEEGTYYSRATGEPLFSSEHKYTSNTGWPSFWRPIEFDSVDYYMDRGLFGARIEVTDAASGSHLGHVFEDGPEPTGLRYCLNSEALIFVPEGEDPPEIVREYLAEYGE